MKVGSGSHQYEWIDGWAKTPAHVKFGYTHGIIVDKKDDVYVFNQSEHALCKFDVEGKFVQSWGSRFASGAHGMLYNVENGTEYLYLTDQKLRLVVKTTLTGEVQWELPMPDRKDLYPDPLKYVPTEVAVAGNGDIFVCDGYGLSFIHQYDKDRKYIRTFGGKGDQPGQCACPHAARIVKRGGKEELYVADRANIRLQVFNLKGEHVRFVKDDLRYPCCPNPWKDELYIPDLHSRVTIFDKNDKLVCHLGDRELGWKVQGWPNVAAAEIKTGLFSSPHNCIVNSRGDIFVAEWISHGRVTKLQKA